MLKVLIKFVIGFSIGMLIVSLPRILFLLATKEPIGEAVQEDSQSIAFWILSSCIGIPLGSRLASSEIKKQQEACKNAAALARQRQNAAISAAAQEARNQIEHARSIAQVQSNVRNAQFAASRLPIFLAEAEFALDRAERELADDIPSSFWEAMESAAVKLGEFNEALGMIDQARKQHDRMAPALKSDAMTFSLGVSLLPDPSSTANRMNSLYRKAQKMKDRSFAIIYEQRRNTAAVIEGFRSLAEAFASFGARLESSINSLSSRIGFHLTDIETALRESSEQMREQQVELLAAAEAYNTESLTLSSELAGLARDSATQAESDAANRRKYEAESITMLNNIQRRRRPFRSLPNSVW